MQIHSVTPYFAVSLTTPSYFGLHVNQREAEQQLIELAGLDNVLGGLTLTALRSQGVLRERAVSLLQAHVGDFQIIDTEIPAEYLSEGADSPLSRR